MRSKLSKQLGKLVAELEADSAPDLSREDTELAGWPDTHFAYLSKPYGIVYRIAGKQLQFLRLAPDGEIPLF